MKMPTILKLVISIALFSGLSSLSHAEKKVVYQGDQSARSICTAIANDKLNQLKRSLRAHKAGVTDTKTHLRFTCNGENLFDFARAMNSSESAYFLAKKFGKKDYVAKHANKIKNKKECKEEKTQQG